MIKFNRGLRVLIYRVASLRHQRCLSVLLLIAAVVFLAAFERDLFLVSTKYRPTSTLEIPERPQLDERITKIAKLTPDTCRNVSTSAFDGIYQGGLWHEGGRMQTVHDLYSDAAWPPKVRSSASGFGSNLGQYTHKSLQILAEAIVDYNAHSMIDMPCGDANWVFDSYVTDSLPFYLGLEIVQPVIEVNRKRLAHHSNKLFRHWDGTACQLPKYTMTGESTPRAFDLVHSRDVIQHLSLHDGIRLLCNILQSGAKVLVVTSYPHGKNKDIATGGYYQNKLTDAPFSFPDVVKCVKTHRRDPDETCVYDLREPWVQEWVKTNKCADLFKSA